MADITTYTARDVLARDEPTGTCCGPLPPLTLEKIQIIDFNFENQD
jgi:hypothetical protein